ncbi:MAG TPA: chorismate pyruvate-lyase family protein [Nitrospiria bacterium]|nr:chorismate pyruvate-lyase family protein [Nitrospiria bacterium]
MVASSTTAELDRLLSLADWTSPEAFLATDAPGLAPLWRTLLTTDGSTTLFLQAYCRTPITLEQIDQQPALLPPLTGWIDAHGLDRGQRPGEQSAGCGEREVETRGVGASPTETQRVSGISSPHGPSHNLLAIRAPAIDLAPGRPVVQRRVWLTDGRRRLALGYALILRERLSPALQERLAAGTHPIGLLAEELKLPSVRDRLQVGRLTDRDFARQFGAPHDSTTDTLWCRRYRLHIPDAMTAAILEIFSPSLEQYQAA